MNKTVIVHGPQGCGKTTHAERMRQHFGLDRVIDDWRWGNNRPPWGALVLTSDEPPSFCADRRVLTYDQAMTLVRTDTSPAALLATL